MTANFLVSMYVLQSGLRNVRVLYGATYVENIAAALVSPTCKFVFADYAASIRRATEQVAVAFESDHTPVHHAYPWSEVADMVLRHGAEETYWI